MISTKTGMKSQDLTVSIYFEYPVLICMDGRMLATEPRAVYLQHLTSGLDRRYYTLNVAILSNGTGK